MRRQSSRRTGWAPEVSTEEDKLKVDSLCSAQGLDVARGCAKGMPGVMRDVVYRRVLASPMITPPQDTPMDARQGAGYVYNPMAGLYAGPGTLRPASRSGTGHDTL